MARKPQAIEEQWPASKTELWALERIIPYPGNPRQHSPEQVDLIARSMKDDGVTSPILVDEEGVIIYGHGRRMAAEKNAFAKYPVVVARGWSEEQKRAYRIKDNSYALLSTWSPELLRIELSELSLAGYEMPLLGFDDVQLVSFLSVPSGADPETIPPVQENAISRTGDLWQLGKHRLLCGDCTNRENLKLLMNGERADLFSTDPPYAVGYGGGNHPATKGNKGKPNRDKNWSQVYVETDDAHDGEVFYDAFVKAAIAEAIKENVAWYCWHSSIRASMVERVWNANGAFAHQQIIWKKSRAVLTFSVYLWAHEPCFMGWIRGKKPFCDTKNNPDFNTTVWDVPNSEIESDEHPTSKPTILFSIPMLLHTKPGGLCFEPFSGSGSQIIAAEKTNRRCFALEISPHFVDVAVRRWQIFAKGDAVLVGDGRTFAEIAKARKGGKDAKSHSRKSVPGRHANGNGTKQAVRAGGDARQPHPKRKSARQPSPVAGDS